MARPLLTALAVAGALGAAEAADTVARDRLFDTVGDFRLGNATDRMDYESIDPVARRLYIADMGEGKLLVFDIDANKLVKSLDDFPKVTGVLAIPELHRVYASVPGAGVGASLKVGLGMLGLASGSGQVAVVDANTLKVEARLPGEVFPDGLTYDPADKRVFVSDELGSAALAIDTTTNRTLARIKTDGEVGNIRYDPVTHRVYVPNQSHSTLVVIDPKALKVVTSYSLSGCQHPHGFILAPRQAIGYAACDENDVLATVDLTNGHVLNTSPVAHDPDVLSVDPERKRLYVAGESGMLSTYDISTAAAPHRLGDVYAGPNAHSVAADPVSHRLYLAIPDLDGHAAVRALAPKP